MVKTRFIFPGIEGYSYIDAMMNISKIDMHSPAISTSKSQKA
jgi:hypothetical protein